VFRAKRSADELLHLVLSFLAVLEDLLRLQPVVPAGVELVDEAS
jgi:hypothetical protein